jgi:hypothetical protein
MLMLGTHIGCKHKPLTAIGEMNKMETKYFTERQVKNESYIMTQWKKHYVLGGLIVR